MTSGFSLIPEGTYIFKIEKVDYDDDFGKIKIDMKTEKGQSYRETYSLKNNDDEWNENALNAFSYFAKNVMNNFEMDDVDPASLTGHYVQADVEHEKVPSKKDPRKLMTFAHLRNLAPAAAFEGEMTEKAETKTEEKTKGIDLDSLLGD